MSKLYLWQNRGLFIGHLPDISEHRLGSAALCVGIDKPFRVLESESSVWQECRSVLVPPGCLNAIQVGGAIMAILFVEPEGPDYPALQNAMLEGEWQCLYEFAHEPEVLAALREIWEHPPDASAIHDLLDPLIPPPEHITNSLALAYTGVALPAEAVFTYQGCKNDICFMPKTIRWRIAADGTTTELADGPVPTEPPLSPANPGFRTAGGYMNADAFLAFLDDRPAETFQWRGWITILLILAGGILLNLTPCVLPMIPINLAIIGAAGNRRTGILYGSAYALGITAAYGSLGLFSLFTGSIFGALQASPWFNLGIGG